MIIPQWQNYVSLKLVSIVTLQLADCPSRIFEKADSLVGKMTIIVAFISCVAWIRPLHSDGSCTMTLP